MISQWQSSVSITHVIFSNRSLIIAIGMLSNSSKESSGISESCLPYAIGISLYFTETTQKKLRQTQDAARYNSMKVTQLKRKLSRML